MIRTYGLVSALLAVGAVVVASVVPLWLRVLVGLGTAALIGWLGSLVDAKVRAEGRHSS